MAQGVQQPDGAGSDPVARPVPELHEQLGAVDERLVRRIRARAFAYRHDRQGVFTWLSDSVADVLGFTKEEFLTNYHTYLTANPVNKEADRHTQLALGGEPQPAYEVELFHKDGTVRVLELVEVPIVGADGAVVGLEGLAIDVTARRQARRQLETLLQEKERLLAELSTYREQLELQVAARTQEIRTLIANVPGVVFRCEAHAPWRVVQMSGQIQAWTGYTARQFIQGQIRWRDVVHPEDAAALIEAVESVSVRRPIDVQFRVVDKANNVLWAHTRAQLVVGPDGASEWLDGVVLDVTLRRQADEARRATEQRLQDLVESITDWVWETDEEGKYSYASPQVRALLGYAPEEVLGRSPLDLMAPEEARRLRPLVERLLQERAPMAHLENVNVRKDGTQVVLETSGAPFFGPNGEYRGYRGVDRDITDRKRINDRLLRAQKLESMGVLAGGIAHDFNNLLGGLFGYLQLAQLDDDAAARASHLAAADSAFEQARALTRQLLTFAKGGDSVKRVVALALIIERSARMAVSGSSCRLVVELDPELWPCDADEHQIGQVISNLCLNAVQAMPEGGVVTVRAGNRASDAAAADPLKPHVRIVVQDAGKGIAAHVLDHIFEPFYTTKVHGTGLGLATCYSIVQRHGGVIEVESEQAHGTTFTVLLPALPGAQPAVSSEAAKAPKGSGMVLIMDDEPVVLSVAARMLERLGYAVQTATDGAEAVKRYSEALRDGHCVRAVILDLTVPGGMGGRQVLDELRRMDPSVCAIASSGYADDPAMARPEEFGFRGSLAKPYRHDVLGTTLARALLGEPGG